MAALRSLDLPEPLSLVGDALFLWNGKFVIYGPSGAFKSFLTQQLLFCISEGIDWFGHTVHKQVPTLYVELESSPRAKQVRLEHLGQAYSIEGANAYHTLDYSFSLAKSYREIIEAVLERGVKVVALDPLNLIMEGSEISGQVMADMTRAANLIRGQTEAMVGFVHHMNKGTYHEGKRVDKGIDEASGHKNLMNWTDTAIRLERIDMPNTVKMRVDKLREGQPPPETWLRYDLDQQILVPAPNDPRSLILGMLESGPLPVGEIDKALREHAGLKRMPASDLRSTMAEEGILERIPDPKNHKKLLMRIRER
jgi:hypothetical protein